MEDFAQILKHYKTKTCILSVSKNPDGTYGNIRVVEGNKAHYEDIAGITGHPFEPGCPYEMCFPKDMNFEDFTIRCAIGGQPMHTYVNLYQMGLWLNLFMIPFESDDEDTGYCIYSYDVAPRADEEKMTDLSVETYSKVLQTCVKLRGTEEFSKVINEVVDDLRVMCESDHCAIMIFDHEKEQCSALAESLNEGSELEPMQKYLNRDFYKMAENWENTLAGSTCVIIKNEQDMEELKRRDPVWHDALKGAGINSVVLFPLKHGEELLGYIWALNFNSDNTVKIKEMLELTTYFVASEVANHLLVKRMEILSTIDLLTGTMNRNTMNNRIDDIISGKTRLREPFAVVFTDLNGLKMVNDTRGHNNGDNMIKDAANIISDVFLDSEIYRAGGDEFMVIAENITPKELSLKITELQFRSSKSDNVRLAIGAVSSVDEPDIISAMRIADQFMYADKDKYYKAHPELRYR